MKITTGYICLISGSPCVARTPSLVLFLAGLNFLSQRFFFGRNLHAQDAEFIGLLLVLLDLIFDFSHARRKLVLSLFSLFGVAELVRRKRITLKGRESAVCVCSQRSWKRATVAREAGGAVGRPKQRHGGLLPFQFVVQVSEQPRALVEDLLGRRPLQRLEMPVDRVQLAAAPIDVGDVERAFVAFVAPLLAFVALRVWR